MSNPDELHAFSEDVRQQVIASADGDDSGEGGAFREDAFTRWMIDVLADAGEFDDGEVCHHRSRGAKVSGYNLDPDEGRLDLFTSIYTQTVPARTVRKDEVDTALRRLGGFLREALNGAHRQLEESSDAFTLAALIEDLKSRLSRVRMFVFTDGLTTVEIREDETIAGLPCSFHIWDLRRTHQCLTSGRGREAIEIDFVSTYGEAIPCLPAGRGPAGEYSAYLMLFPGYVMHRIYADHGARLLERNVRAFLQARGKVNRGIRETILREPDNFLAYNNGISATADAVDLVALPDGRCGIRWVRDFQIVNGGQTTASIYHAATRDRADVSRLQVQAKLTVVEGGRLDEMVPLISRYANSQNKISEADFSANDPFHVRVQELSRTVWAPAVDGTQRQTRWFYERARGQYSDELAKQTTVARKRAFQVIHPTAQKFTKTDLAKYEHTWSQLPHLVSRGAQKNFADFAIRLAERGRFEPDEAYFQRLVAKGILFRTAEKVVRSMDAGGYRANVVTYTLAYLSHRTAQRIDLDAIWRLQRVSTALLRAIEVTAERVREVIVDSPNGQNVTEWCKREQCWKSVQQLEVALPPAFELELLGRDAPATSVDRGVDNTADAGDRELINRITAVDAQRWFELANWAKETGNLQPWQRSLAFSLGKLAAQSREPSRKQAVQGVKILDQSSQLGFRV